MKYFSGEIRMVKEISKLDKIILETRQNAEKRAKGYREQALKLFPWICGRCARSFDHKNLQLLEVHHKNNNHDDNPSDGSNWELLCTYCHENEHSKIKDSLGRNDSENATKEATYSPFADLKNMMKK
jgi:HNH endonuclease